MPVTAHLTHQTTTQIVAFSGLRINIHRNKRALNLFTRLRFPPGGSPCISLHKSQHWAVFITSRGQHAANKGKVLGQAPRTDPDEEISPGFLDACTRNLLSALRMNSCVFALFGLVYLVWCESCLCNSGAD